MKHLLDALGLLDDDDVLPIYIGDDTTDEDAFEVLVKDKPEGLGILVSSIVWAPQLYLSFFKFVSKEFACLSNLRHYVHALCLSFFQCCSCFKMKLKHCPSVPSCLSYCFLKTTVIYSG